MGKESTDGEVHEGAEASCGEVVRAVRSRRGVGDQRAGGVRPGRCWCAGIGHGSRPAATTAARLATGAGNATRPGRNARRSIITCGTGGARRARSARWAIRARRCWRAGSTSWSRANAGSGGLPWMRGRVARRWSNMPWAPGRVGRSARSWGSVPMSCETGSTRCLRATTRSVRWATTRTRAERRSPARTGTAMTVADPLRACGGNATGYVRS